MTASGGGAGAVEAVAGAVVVVVAGAVAGAVVVATVAGAVAGVASPVCVPPPEHPARASTPTRTDGARRRGFGTMVVLRSGKAVKGVRTQRR
ncbi:conserved exported protein of unknown function [Streptomyces sp. KY75]|nr:conserved exported protein of unknown function [Streptomyces sp. KY75]